MPSLHITDIKAIRKLDLELPKAGLIVFRGQNGSGKSTAIDAVAALANAKSVRLEPHDDAERGEVRLDWLDGKSVLLKVGKVMRKNGTLEDCGVEVLTGKYTIADLIAPAFKDPRSRDDHAIKTLAQLGGPGDASLFYHLVGDEAEFDKLVPLEVAGSLDIVALAGKIERALHARALDEEKLATSCEGKADELNATANGIDLEAESDSDTLHDALEAAIAAGATLRQQASDAAAKVQAAAKARESLEHAQQDYTGPTVEEATLTRDVTAAEVTRVQDALEAAKAIVADAERKLVERLATAKQAAADLRYAAQQQSTIAAFEVTVQAAESVVLISDSELTAASEAVNAAREAVNAGVLVRKAQENLDSAKQYRLTAKEHMGKANGHRDAAKGVDDVLSQLVQRLGGKLFVKRGSLMVKSDRGDESFWDLSDGERSEIAVSVFAKAVGAHGLLTLPQSFWEGLDFAGRKRIAELIEKVGVLAFTAECDKVEGDEELRGEVFSA